MYIRRFAAISFIGLACSESSLAQDDVVLTLVKDGDHRLSRPEDLERMLAVVAEF